MVDDSRSGWRFFRAGGFDQAIVDSADALLRLETLDQKLWAALSCPVHGIECDPVTLSLIDADGDGHIRPAEIVAAVKWAAARLKDPAILLERRADLPLAAIDDSRPQGRDLLAAARRMLAAQKIDDAQTVTADQAAEGEKLFAQMPFNGDGIVIAESAEDEFTASVLADIVACLDGVPDRSGKPGVQTELLDGFFAELETRAAWLRHFAEDDALRPVGEETPAAEAALAAVEAKVEDYFIRTGLASFDLRAAEAMNGSPEDWQALASHLLGGNEERLAAFPLARIVPDQPLPLADGLNPLWRDRMDAFRTQTVVPLLGPVEHLSLAAWRQLQAAFAAYRKHLAAKPTDRLDRLEGPRVQAILASPARATIASLIARDQALADEAAAMTTVGRLVRYLRDLVMLIDNFVSFADFYGRHQPAVFQAGTLYIDRRACSLCIRVDSIEKHAVLAAMGRIYLLYCECRRPQTDGKIYIAAAVTAGDSDQLLVGRNGIFYDRDGLDWDATVVRVIDHPISIRQAFLSPYKKVGRMVATQLEKFASDRSTAVQTGAAATLADPTKLAAATGGTTGQVFDAARFAGTLAAVGLAVGALGTAVASVVTGFLHLPWWEVPLAVLGVLALISGPSVAIAAFKLRLRTIGPLLDANGWAVNTRAGITIAFGAALTAEAKLPKGAGRALRDPYAEKGPNWLLWAVAAGVVLGLAAVWHWRLWTPLGGG